MNDHHKYKKLSLAEIKVDFDSAKSSASLLKTFLIKRDSCVYWIESSVVEKLRINENAWFSRD